MREVPLGALQAALTQCHPYRLTRAALPEPIAPTILAAGKAAGPMLAAALEQFPDAPGFGVTRYGHGQDLGRFPLLEAGHPLPDSQSFAAGARALELARSLGPQDTLLVLLSGGGSAVMAAALGIDQTEKIALTEALLASGATIGEINCVRKHVSSIKGGRLALAAYPARVIALALSDVPGDNPASIASGPVVADPSSYEEALTVLEHYQVDRPKTRAFLAAGARGDYPETPKPGDPRIAKVEFRIIGKNRDLLTAAARFLELRGLPCRILTDRYQGSAQELARAHGRLLSWTTAPMALLSGGEASVAVTGAGQGGRNLEFLLWLLLMTEKPNFWALAADSDGIDGNSGVAGAIITPDSRERARWLGLDPQEFLRRHDSKSFFASLGDLVVTGPTQNNLNDFRLVINVS